VQTFGINETKRSGAAHAAKNCIPNFGRHSAPKTNIFAATKPNPLCAARQARRVRAPSSASRMKSYNNVSVINTATNMVVATVPMGDDPRGVAVTPNRKETCRPADPGDARPPWLEDAQRAFRAGSVCLNSRLATK
jgi:YVTN family beta-propeller protein